MFPYSKEYGSIEAGTLMTINIPIVNGFPYSKEYGSIEADKMYKELGVYTRVSVLERVRLH